MAEITLFAWEPVTVMLIGEEDIRLKRGDSIILDPALMDHMVVDNKFALRQDRPDG